MKKLLVIVSVVIAVTVILSVMATVVVVADKIYALPPEESVIETKF